MDMTSIAEKTRSQVDRLRDAEFDVFMSHAAIDAEPVDEAVRQVKEAGITVFVNRTEDTQLDRWAVTRETAALLRRWMRACRVLVLGRDGAIRTVALESVGAWILRWPCRRGLHLPAR
jgi:cytosine/adenosine deaminase-related metal-dependent hydrolase